jgi:acyl-coenzyme A thioesterase PaaI-like protein
VSWIYSPLLAGAAQQQAGAAEISCAASQTLGIVTVATGTVSGGVISAVADQTLGIVTTGAATVAVQGQATQTLGIVTVATGTVSGGVISAVADQTLGIVTTGAATTLPPIAAAANQVLGIVTTARALLGGEITIWRAVHDAIYTALTTALSGVAAVYDDVPHNAAYPYVDIAAQNRTPTDTLRNHGFTFHFYPAIYSQYKGQREVRQILDAIDTALHDVHLSLATGAAVRCQVTDSRCVRDQDGRTYQGGATIEIFVVV